MESLLVNQISPNHKNSVSLTDLATFKGSHFPILPFENIIIEFLDAFSKNVLSNKEINKLPEIAALGFWLRKNTLEKLKNDNKHLFNHPLYKIAPLGKVLHICPANVDTMFMYSLAVSLLMGNKNILRVSNRMEAAHVFQLFKILNNTLAEEEFQQLSEYITIITYNHNEAISSWISQRINARIIWGGDQTIKTFKKFITSPRTKDIVFADRVSLLCINCASYLKLTHQENQIFIKNFFNDAYTFDQMGCSSPQTIYFIGSKEDYLTAKINLQNSISDYLKLNYKTDISSLASLKLNRMVDDSINNIITGFTGNNYISFLEISKDTDESQLHGCGGGYFYVKNISTLSELKNISNIKIQTISYYGLSDTEKNDLIYLANGEGIDRIVPLGKALNFNYIWDGYNLFDELSKKIYIEL